MNTLLKLFGKYDRLLKRRPLPTTVISTGIILSTGDLLMQLFEIHVLHKKKSPEQQKKQIRKDSEYLLTAGGQSMSIMDFEIIDENQYKKQEPQQLEFKRFAHMFIFGIVGLGPMSYGWYIKLLPRLVPVAAGKKITSKQLFYKILLDETAMSFAYYSAFLYIMSILDGKGAKGGLKSIYDGFMTCYVSDLFFWPWVQYLNFRFVPIHLQSLIVSMCSVFWGGVLSYIYNN